jgi:cation:H+ antiporter
MLLSVVGLLLLFVPLAVSANAFVDGASALSRRFGVPPLVVGLTVVAFGTSAPELVVNVFAAVSGSSGIVLGNVIGSNLFNALAILGVAGLIIPFHVHRRATRVELPLSMLVAVLLIAMAADPLLDGATARRISRTEGILALGLFSIFLYTLLDTMRDGREEAAVRGPAAVSGTAAPPPALSGALLRLIAGLAVLLSSARVIVLLAVGVANGFGVPERIVALTVVSVGTSLPELVTSVAAARRRETDIAIGNVLGSNIFNVLLILAVSAIVAPVPVPGAAFVDLLAHLGATALVFLVVLTGGGRTVTRVEAAVLLLAYGAYMSLSVLLAL